jgi:exonuclease SbcC
VVSANISLDDGRTVEMYQDLNGKVDCRARDLGMGAADISNEIMFDGSPDASRWLGLDRRSFASTATVNQAELLKILQDADGLQEHLQRAAATAGTTDATAAAALTRLDTFSRDHVGLDRANSTRPLHMAKTGLMHATAALCDARVAHDQYLDLVTDANDARQLAHMYADEVTRLQRQTGDLESLLEKARVCSAAALDVDRLTERVQNLATDLATANEKLSQARGLDAQFAGHAPAGTARDDDTAQLVTAALAAYRSLVPVAPLSGPTSAELGAALAALPQRPFGDKKVDHKVRTVFSELAQCAGLLTLHGADRPQRLPKRTPEQVAAITAGPDLLRELARALSMPIPIVDPTLIATVARTKIEESAATIAQAAAEERLVGAESALQACGSVLPRRPPHWPPNGPPH